MLAGLCYFTQAILECGGSPPPSPKNEVSDDRSRRGLPRQAGSGHSLPVKNGSKPPHSKSYGLIPSHEL
jgi:hypothetical protein